MCRISPGVLTGGQIHSITFMPGDVPHMHSVSSVAIETKNPELNILHMHFSSVKCIGK